MSEPTNPATLYVRGLNDKGPWTELGKTPVSVPGPEALKAFREFSASMQRAVEQIAKGFTLTMKTSLSPAALERLRRVLIAPDNRRCYTCQRHFPGPWQRVKHERTAHRGR